MDFSFSFGQTPQTATMKSTTRTILDVGSTLSGTSEPIFDERFAFCFRK
jgi:hypothetical protein